MSLDTNAPQSTVRETGSWIRAWFMLQFIDAERFFSIGRIGPIGKRPGATSPTASAD